jgi:hypothetical protein
MFGGASRASLSERASFPALPPIFFSLAGVLGGSEPVQRPSVFLVADEAIADPRASGPLVYDKNGFPLSSEWKIRDNFGSASWELYDRGKG